MFKAELQANRSSRLNHQPLCTFPLHSTQQEKLKHPEPCRLFLEAPKSQKCFRPHGHGVCSFSCRCFCPSDHLSPLCTCDIEPFPQLKVLRTLQSSMVQLIPCLGTTSFVFLWNKADGKLAIINSEVPCLAQFFSSIILKCTKGFF